MKKEGVKKHGHLILLILIFVLALYIIYLGRFFIIPLITAAIFSYITYPLFTKIKNKTNHPKWSSLITVIILTILVLIPLILALFFMGKEIITISNSFKFDMISDKLDFVRVKINEVVDININSEDFSEIIKNVFMSSKEVIIKSSVWIVNGIAKAIFQLVFILIFMFYFFLKGPQIFEKSKVFIPFSSKGKNFVLDRFESDIKALFLGQGLVALAQGVLAGIGFAIAGIENIFLWGFMVSLMSFLPIVGTTIVWIPASVYLILKGSTGSAIFLFLWGLIIISNIDNLLRPIIVKSFSKINFLTVLLGVIIGIKAFGLIGIIIGPLLISILISLVHVYYLENLEENKRKSRKKQPTKKINKKQKTKI